MEERKEQEKERKGQGVGKLQLILILSSQPRGFPLTTDSLFGQFFIFCKGLDLRLRSWGTHKYPPYPKRMRGDPDLG